MLQKTKPQIKVKTSINFKSEKIRFLINLCPPHPNILPQMPTQTFYGVLGAKSVLAGFMSIPFKRKNTTMR
jgi:hypothetical protein